MYPATKLITPPSEEPVTLVEAKLQCQVDHTEEDTRITELIQSAREYVSDVSNRQLVTATWDVFYPYFPGKCLLRLPFGSLQSVSAFEWTLADGTTGLWTVSGGNLLDGSTVKAHIDTVEEPNSIRLAYGQSWPCATLRTMHPLRVRIACGYGAATAVPASFKNAMKLLINWWFDNPEAATVGNSASAVSTPLAFGVDNLLANYILRLY